MIINFEGIDGSGKTSLAKKLADEIGAEYIHYPNDSGFTGPILRGYLRGKWSIYNEDGIDTAYGPLAFQALQIVNRIEQIPAMRRCEGSKNNHMILDRYWPSCAVYGQLDGLPRDWLIDMQSVLPRADKYVWMKCSPEVALERLKAKGSTEMYDRLPSLSKAAELYEDLWERNSMSAAWVSFDAHRDTQDLLKEVCGWF